MRIIITGASGFVGLNLAQFLATKDCEVLKLSLRDTNWKKTMDHNATAIIHLAGKAHDTSNSSNAEEYFKVNRDLTKEVFEEFLNSSIQDFFYFSSVKAVADTVEGVLHESTEAKPLTPYGISKMEAENYLLQQKLPAGKRLFIIRPCMIHGPGNKGNLNLLYKIVEKGLPWPLASFENRRSFLSIDNLNFIIYQLLSNKTIPSGVFNVADDAALSTNELVSLIAEELGRKPRLLKLPQNLVQLAAKVGDVLPIPLNSERLKKLTENYVVSNSKIKKVLGIETLPVSAKEGLRLTIDSFK